MVSPGAAKAFLWSFLFFLFFNSSAFGQIKTSSSSYRIVYTSTSRYFVAYKYIHTLDSQTIVVGKWGDTEDGADLLIMKLDESGEVVWSKKVAVGIQLREYELTEMSDGSFVFLGNSWYNGPPTGSDMLVIKFTCKGDIVWSRNLSMDRSVSQRFMEAYSIREGRNNDAIISFYGGPVNSMFTVVCRVSSSGNLVWSKTFYGIEAETALPSKSFFSDNKIVVFAFKSLYSNYYNYNRSLFAMKLNYENGAVEETKAYNYSEFMTNQSVLVSSRKVHFDAEQLANGTFAVYGVFSNMDKQNKGYCYKFLIRKDLSIKETKAFSIPYELAVNRSKIRVFPNGQTHIISDVYEREKLFWFGIDSANNKIREKKIDYPGAYLQIQFETAQSGPNRATYIVNTAAQANSSIEVVQAEDKTPADIKCLGTDTSYTGQLPLQVSNGNVDWKTVKDNEATLQARQFTTSEVTVTRKYICEPIKGQTPESNQLKIRGEDTVCFSVSASSYNYVGSAKSGTTPVQWELDSDQKASLSRLNDSTVSVSFKKPEGKLQQVKLYGYSGSCSVLKDSISITIFPENNKLPTNYNICDLPVKLQPGSWFKNYLWQDGSTDSVYLVTKPGKYFVKLQTFCGASVTDTIEIAASGTGIKKNYSICENDSVTVSANGGYSKYEWGPMYNLTQISPSAVQLYPAKDTLYTLKITTLQGCEVTDTVFVTVHKPVNINLGPDAVICQNETLNLDAGSYFSAYTWNTGATMRNLIVDRPGTYYISARDKNNCLVSDTINVREVKCQNMMYIPNAFTPNGDGKNDVFKPLITGRLAEYELTVYNRLGQVVFTTNEVGNGWTGTYKGLQQKTETYVWVCKYRFENENLKMEKGTVLLIL